MCLAQPSFERRADCCDIEDADRQGESSRACVPAFPVEIVAISPCDKTTGTTGTANRIESMCDRCPKVVLAASPNATLVIYCFRPRSLSFRARTYLFRTGHEAISEMGSPAHRNRSAVRKRHLKFSFNIKFLWAARLQKIDDLHQGFRRLGAGISSSPVAPKNLCWRS